MKKGTYSLFAFWTVLHLLLLAETTFACRDCNPSYTWTVPGPGGEYGLWGWPDGDGGTLWLGSVEIFLPVSAPVAAAVIGAIFFSLLFLTVNWIYRSLANKRLQHTC